MIKKQQLALYSTMTDQIQIISLFSTPIYFLEDSGHVFTSDEIEFIQNLELNPNLISTNKVSNGTYILNDQRLKTLKETCQTHLNNFTRDALKIKQEFYITNSWIAKSNGGESHQIHNHQNCIFSGVIYVNASPDMGNLRLYGKPGFLKSFDFEYDYLDFNLHNSFFCDLPVNTGTIIIFPSDVRHSTEINQTDEARIAVGFNAFVRGEFGKEENSNYCSELTL